MKIIYALCLALCSISAGAQVVINEFSCANFTHSVDNYGEHEDWIELYNPSPSPVNIGGYHLSDRTTQPTKWSFPAGTTLPANSYMIVYASGRDESIGNNHHTNFRLSQTKFPTEQIVFSDASGNIIDQLTIAPTKKQQSRGRNPNGGANWKIYLSPTPGFANNSSSSRDRFAATPQFSLTAGFYNGSQTVTITTSEPNSFIHYTVDGTEPTSSSPVYTGSVVIDSTTVLKAITVTSTPLVIASFTKFATYFINENHTLPVVSIAADDLTDLANGTGSLRPEGSWEYFDTMNVRKTAGYGEFNRHGKDSWALDQRSLDFIMRDEFGYNYAIQEELFNLTTRDEFQRIILRAAGDDNYPAAHRMANEGSAHLRDAYVQNLAKKGGLNVDVRIATKCIAYLNGQYWGVYDLRDNPDHHDYTEYYYGQGKYDLQYIETWGSTWAEYGGNQALNDWDAFRSYVMSNNMNNAATWDYVTSQLDVTSLADYVIFNSLTVCSDWLNYNTGWWRGLDSSGSHKRWGYILWDNDATFGFYINYTGIPETGPHAAPCNVESGLDDPEEHIDLLNKLRTNPTFNHYYISRYIDLANTVFSCDYMLDDLDSITAVIDPEMTRHAIRWYGTYTEWKSNVQELRDYIQTRCNALPALMDSCYNLTGPYSLHITTNPIGTGKIKINSLVLSDFPWTGNYHGGIPVYITALPDTLNSFTFDRWETLHNVVGPSVLVPNAELNLTSSDTLIAYFIQHTASVPENDKNNFSAFAYPPVFSNETRIFVESKNGSETDIVLYSMLGNPVARIKSEKTGNEKSSFVLNAESLNLAKGIYFLNFKSDKVNYTLRLVYAGN